MTLPSIEDPRRYTAPPEPTEEQWLEPEDYVPYDDEPCETDDP